MDVKLDLMDVKFPVRGRGTLDLGFVWWICKESKHTRLPPPLDP